MFMPPTNHSAAIQKSWPTKIGHVQTRPTKVGQRKKLANMYDTRQTFVGLTKYPTGPHRTPPAQLSTETVRQKTSTSTAYAQTVLK